MLPRLHAERQLLAIQAAAFPEMKERDRGETMGRLRRALDGPEAPPKTKEEMLAALAASGITVRHRPPRKNAGHAGTRRKGKRD